MAGGFVSQVDGGGTIARGAQCTDAVAVLPAAVASGEIAALSRVVSFDLDGFTLETSRLTSALPLAVLALDGGNFKVGVGAASSRATAVGFELAGALLFGTGLDAATHARDIGRLCVGGFSRDRRAGCVSWSTRRRGAWPPEPRSRSSSEAVFEVVDTTSGGLHARATLSAFSGRRFSLSWPCGIALPETSATSRSEQSPASRGCATGYVCSATATRCANRASSTRTATGVAASGSATL